MHVLYVHNLTVRESRRISCFVMRSLDCDAMCWNFWAAPFSSIILVKCASTFEKNCVLGMAKIMLETLLFCRFVSRIMRATAMCMSFSSTIGYRARTDSRCSYSSPTSAMNIHIQYEIFTVQLAIELSAHRGRAFPLLVREQQRHLSKVIAVVEVRNTNVLL